MKQSNREIQWLERLKDAPEKGYLAVDVIKLNHDGECIEGIDRQYTQKGIAWGHRFTTSSLVVVNGQAPYMLRADAAPSGLMSSTLKKSQEKLACPSSERREAGKTSSLQAKKTQ